MNKRVAPTAQFGVVAFDDRLPIREFVFARRVCIDGECDEGSDEKFLHGYLISPACSSL